MSRETWRPIPSAPGWIASSQGRIAMLPRLVAMPHGGFKILEVKPTKGVYRKSTNRFTQSVNGRTVRIAPLVCEAFNGPKPSATHECMHLDEDSTNDCPTNLAWGTRSENMSAPKLQKRRSERLLASHPRRRLTEQNVREIRASAATSSYSDLAEQYGVCADYVRQIVKGRQRASVRP